MKKVISVFLAVLELLRAFGMTAVAVGESGYIPVHTVHVNSDSEGKIAIIGIEDPNNTVPHGRPFYFTIQYLGGYRPDETTVIKCYPASYMPDLVVTEEDTTEIITLTPDGNGVYTIPSVTEDYYVGAYNLTTNQFAGIKDMLVQFFNAFIAFFKRIFNR